MGSIKAVLGERVRHFRKRIGLSQGALADSCGLAKESVYLLEKGKVWPEYGRLERLADSLGVPVEALFDISSNPIKPIPEEALEVLREALSLRSSTKIR